MWRFLATVLAFLICCSGHAAADRAITVMEFPEGAEFQAVQKSTRSAADSGARGRWRLLSVTGEDIGSCLIDKSGEYKFYSRRGRLLFQTLSGKHLFSVWQADGTTAGMLLYSDGQLCLALEKWSYLVILGESGGWFLE